jgi:alpha-aminoadipate carrier protein LysW
LAKCPDCEGEIRVPDDATVGEIVSCPDCGLDLEIKQINLDRVDLKEISIEKEDWGE